MEQQLAAGIAAAEIEAGKQGAQTKACVVIEQTLGPRVAAET